MEGPLALEIIRPIAERVKGELAPFCELIEIAGSIRRQRPYCGDIDLVVLPKERELENLKLRCARSCDVVVDGPMNFICRMRGNLTRNASPHPGPLPSERARENFAGLQIDIFIAQRETRELFTCVPTNFGSLMVCRTGSVQHNIFLVERAKRMDLRWNPYHGVFMGKSGKCIASATEEEIFKALGLEFIAPERRER